ncbi:hypothetical protein WA158_005727 [Blastocystis sp. Blastoise]
MSNSKLCVDDYEVNAKIGSGAFGDIHIGKNKQNNALVAIKLESDKTKSPQLSLESKLYQLFAGGYGIPNMYLYKQVSHYNVLVMDLLGPSLEDLFNFCGRTFSKHTVYQLAIEMITRVEYIHDCDFIHRDIKPDNFVIGMGENHNVVYIIDYGLSKRYFNSSNGTHISYRENRHLTGTPRYASLANHLGIEQSRRDDLESLGYVFLYFLKGKLPWQGLNAMTKKQKYNKIMECKIENSFQTLCNGLPDEFCYYFDYCRSLRFDDKPDYEYLKGLFMNCLKKENLAYDGRFDWMVKDKQDTTNCIPAHCKTRNNTLKDEFLLPSKEEYRRNKKPLPPNDPHRPVDVSQLDAKRSYEMLQIDPNNRGNNADMNMSMNSLNIDVNRRNLMHMNRYNPMMPNMSPYPGSSLDPYATPPYLMQSIGHSSSSSHRSQQDYKNK